LKALALSRIQEPVDESLPFDGNSVADLEAGKSGHQLPRPPLSDPEEFLNAQAVQVRGFQFAQLPQNFVKSMEPGRLGRHDVLSLH
jgi:hypothetical protein